MADTEWKREKKTTDKGEGKYLLEWVDENGDTLCSMEIMIENGDVEKTIETNYRLMRKENEELFAEPLSDEEIAMMMEEVNG